MKGKIAVLMAGIMAMAFQVSANAADANTTKIVNKIEAANAQMKNVESTFEQVRSFKASGRKVGMAGTLYFKSDGSLAMRYSKPAGESLIINGKDFYMNKGGKSITFDTSKNGVMGCLANTLVNCIKGNPAKVAADNNAEISATETSEGYEVSLVSKESNAAHKGYSKIVLVYRKSDCLLLRMTMVEFTGITNVYEMTGLKRNTMFSDEVFKIPAKTAAVKK